MARRPTSTILHSDRAAEAIGRPLNTEVIFRFWKTGLPFELMSKLFELEIRGRRFAYWSKPIVARKRIERNGDPTFAWVAEGGREWPHIHWCLHVRPGLDESFLAFLKRCWKSIPELAAVPFNELFEVREVYDFRRYKLYLCKGAEPHYAKYCKIRVLREQGEIVGKRCGVSANLSRAARRRLGLR